MPQYKINFSNFYLEFLKGVQSSDALITQIYFITNGLRGRQAFVLPEL
jgi:hypothetical protein